MSNSEELRLESVRSTVRTTNSSLPRAAASAAPRAKPDQDLVIVGGCHGLYLLPADDLPGFYRGYKCAALVGAALLCLFLFFRVMA